MNRKLDLRLRPFEEGGGDNDGDTDGGGGGDGGEPGGGGPSSEPSTPDTSYSAPDSSARDPITSTNDDLSRSGDQFCGPGRDNGGDPVASPATKSPSQDNSDARPHTKRFSVGFSESALFAVGFGAMPGVGAQAGVNYTPAIGAVQESAGVYLSIFGIGIAYGPRSPSLNFTYGEVSASHGTTPFDCVDASMILTPLGGIGTTYDNTTHERTSVTLSISISISLGYSSGMYCGISHY